MKRLTKSAIAMAVAAALPGLSFAVVDLDLDTGTPTYASELIATQLTDSTGAVDTTNAVGFGFSGGQVRYIRYNLTNATFGGQVVATDLTIGTQAAGVGVVVATAGASGNNYVIFQVTAPVGGLASTAASLFAAGDNNLNVTDPTPVEISYALYETAGNAVSQSSALATASGTLANFASGLTFTATGGLNTASVADQYLTFTDTSKAATKAVIGTVLFDDAGYLDANGAATTAISQFVAAGTKLIVRGDDLSASKPFAGIYVCNSSTGAPSTPVGTNKTTTSVELVTDTSPVSGANNGICFELPASGRTTQIAAQSFTIEADVVPASGSSTSDQPAITLGRFVRNGTVLIAL